MAVLEKDGRGTFDVTSVSQPNQVGGRSSRDWESDDGSGAGRRRPVVGKLVIDGELESMRI